MDLDRYEADAIERDFGLIFSRNVKGLELQFKGGLTAEEIVGIYATKRSACRAFAEYCRRHAEACGSLAERATAFAEPKTLEQAERECARFDQEVQAALIAREKFLAPKKGGTE